MPFAIEAERKTQIDEKYIGFGPYTSRVNPAHLANGLFRAAVGQTFDTELLNRFVFWQQADGRIPPGHELETLFNQLVASNRLEADINKDDLKRLRVLLKAVVNADGTVYLHKDRMESYTAGYQGFLSEDRIAQDGGELIAEWLRARRSPLLDYIQQALTRDDDTISLLCTPLLGEPHKTVQCTLDSGLRFLYHPDDLPPAPRHLWAGLTRSAKILASHLRAHPNKLLGLRLSVLFASFVLIRHLACLEACYVPGAGDRMIPFLLDFSEVDEEPVARASLMSYTQVCQSIARFYGWAFAQRLQAYTSLEGLAQEPPPLYRNRALSPEAAEIWQLAMVEVKQATNPYMVCGQALYDALAQDAQANPIIYLRQLGHRCGLLWPPVNTQPSKRFVVQQGTLEMLIRGVVEPGESIGSVELKERLWTHYGLIIGGRPVDEERLLALGIYQADSTALEQNSRRFARQLSRLDFARMLADGVLQVTLEG